MVPHGPSPFSIACSRLRDSGEKSFSKKKREKRAGAGQRQGIFLAATSPFPKLRPHYTTWEPGTGYVQHSSCIKYMIVSFFKTEAFSLRIHELKMKSGFLSSNGTEQSEALSVSVWFRSKDTEGGDFRFWPREKWNESHFSRGLWLSFLVLFSWTAQKRLLRRLDFNY